MAVLNKKVFMGVYLKYIVPAILLLAQSCCASIDTEEKFENTAQQWMWKGVFSNVLRGNEGLDDKDKWIQDSYYDESVYNVITKALADCKLKLGEFADMDREGFKIIEFNAKPYSQAYTRANWNAVILWNYVTQIYYHNIVTEVYKDNDECIDKIGEKVRKYYREKPGIQNLNMIDDSIKDIKAYISALKSVFPTRKDYQEPVAGFDKETKNGCIVLENTYFSLSNQTGRGRSDIIVNIRDGKIESCKIYNGAIVKMDNTLRLGKVIEKMDAIAFSLIKRNKLLINNNFWFICMKAFQEMWKLLIPSDILEKELEKELVYFNERNLQMEKVISNFPTKLTEFAKEYKEFYNKSETIQTEMLRDRLLQNTRLCGMLPEECNYVLSSLFELKSNVELSDDDKLIKYLWNKAFYEDEVNFLNKTQQKMLNDMEEKYKEMHE